jgi:coproporphyrinogen III oxidase
MHYSWTEMRDGSGYWRMMADLNPAIEDSHDTEMFIATLQGTAPEVYAEASAQGDRYFYIPALDRHRGVAHFYLEGFTSGDFESDASLARSIGDALIDCYVALLQGAIESRSGESQADRDSQLAYHTLYLVQVLTLDRGTTSGLLVHDQNDLGILASLPSHVDRELLASWESRVPTLQGALIRTLVAALPPSRPCPVDDATRVSLAAGVREHYKNHPEALSLQAAGNQIPPTVSNHGPS